MTGFDVIGDVHGHAHRLQHLLARMGYTERHGVWAHSNRTAVFLGDLIDRGPGQLDTLQTVRAMVETGSAQIVLGNHEFNAVAYATHDPERDDYCRSHNDKHTSQHEAFLADVIFGSSLHRSIIDWFTTIPLWLDLGGLRVVHACWSADHIEHLEAQTGPGNTLTEQTVIDATTKGTPTHEAVETVLKGPEGHLDGVRYLDKDGHPRDHAGEVLLNPATAKRSPSEASPWLRMSTACFSISMVFLSPACSPVEPLTSSRTSTARSRRSSTIATRIRITQGIVSR